MLKYFECNVFLSQTRTQADMVFDLSRYLDFSLKFLDTDLEGIIRNRME